MATATVTSKGQITLPKEVRERLHLESGDRVNFVVEPDGRVLLQPATVRVTELKGLLQRKGQKPVSVEAMNAAIARRAGRRP
jgi:AbrB family looped-hinge helix DNA binding protein